MGTRIRNESQKKLFERLSSAAGIIIVALFGEKQYLYDAIPLIVLDKRQFQRYKLIDELLESTPDGLSLEVLPVRLNAFLSDGNIVKRCQLQYDVLRDVFLRGQYRDVILPMVVLLRLDALLEPTKGEVDEELLRRFNEENQADIIALDRESQGFIKSLFDLL